MMPLRRWPVLLLLSLLIPPAALAAAQSTEVPSDLRIELVRTDCFTWCAAYTLTIHGDGRVVYLGVDNVKVVGEASGRMDPEAIELGKTIDRESDSRKWVR